MAKLVGMSRAWWWSCANAPFIAQEKAVDDNNVMGTGVGICENRDDDVARHGVADTHAKRQQSWRGRQSNMGPQCGTLPKAEGRQCSVTSWGQYVAYAREHN